MDLGLCLDEDLFEKKEAKKQNHKQQQPYNVKVCEKGWPFDCPSPDDAVQRQNITKFQADFWYRDGQYDKALRAYTGIHSNPQVASTTVERDITESVIRCHLKLMNFNAAFEHLSDLVQKQGADTSLLLLLARICSATGNVQSEICCYKRCILLHSYNHNFWYSLALAYKKVQNSKHKQEVADKHLNGLIETLLQSSMAPCHRDCLKICLNCTHCKCTVTQEIMLLDKLVLSISNSHEKDNQYSCNGSEVNNLNETEQFENTEISSLLEKDSKSKSGSKSLGSCNTEEEPYVRIGLGSEDSVDDKSCDFNITIQHLDSIGHRSRKIPSIDNYYILSLFTFFCLLRTRFLLQRAIWTSSSFVKEKLLETMCEVKKEIKCCVLCQCGELKKCILKQIESDDVHLVGQQLEDLDMHALYNGCDKKHWT